MAEMAEEEAAAGAGGTAAREARHPAYEALTQRWAAAVAAARGADPGGTGSWQTCGTPAQGTPARETQETAGRGTQETGGPGIEEPSARATPAPKTPPLEGRAPSPLPYAENLLARWAEPQRRYHTVDHLVAVLDRVDVLEEYAQDPAVVRLAAWFHDAVYLPDRSTNEERSARLAERALPELGVDASRTAEVARLVRLTITHDPRPGDTDGAVLCDADLAILAAPPEAYAAYTAAVREEYAFVPPDAFRAGRAAVLRQLLDLPGLFRTPYGQREWETPARDNLRAELTRLS